MKKHIGLFIAAAFCALSAVAQTTYPTKPVKLMVGAGAGGGTDIIARMLRNLKEIHRAQEDWARLVAVQNRLVILLPEAWGEWRDRGLAHAEQGHTELAVQDLEVYLANAQDALDIDAVADHLANLRRARS